MEGLLAKSFDLPLFRPGLETPFLLAEGLAQALGMAAGIINAFGLVAVFGGLIGACISALSERHVGGVKTSLVISAVGGLGVGDLASHVCSGRDANQSPNASR